MFSGSQCTHGTTAAQEWLGILCWFICSSQERFAPAMPKPCGLGTEQPVLPRVRYPPGIPDKAVARKPGMAVLSKGSLLLAGHFLPVAEQSKANAGAELSPAVTPSTTGTAPLP